MITALPIQARPAQVNLGRRKISEGIAAIGVGDGDSNDRGLDSMIWRGTSASDAVFLLKKRRWSVIHKLSPIWLTVLPNNLCRQAAPTLWQVSWWRRVCLAGTGWPLDDLAVLANQLPVRRAGQAETLFVEMN